MNKFVKYPIEKATQVPDGGLVMIYKDRYWEVDSGDLLFYGGFSPQCNSNKSIVERMASKAGHEVVFLKQVFVPMRETMEGCEIDLDDTYDTDPETEERLFDSDAGAES